MLSIYMRGGPAPKVQKARQTASKRGSSKSCRPQRPRAAKADNVEAIPAGPRTPAPGPQGRRPGHVDDQCQRARIRGPTDYWNAIHRKGAQYPSLGKSKARHRPWRLKIPLQRSVPPLGKSDYPPVKGWRLQRHLKPAEIGQEGCCC